MEEFPLVAYSKHKVQEIDWYTTETQEKLFYSESGQTLEWDAQRGYGISILEDTQNPLDMALSTSEQQSWNRYH